MVNNLFVMLNCGHGVRERFEKMMHDMLNRVLMVEFVQKEWCLGLE